MSSAYWIRSYITRQEHAKVRMHTALAQDIEDADLALWPEDALTAFIEARSLVEIRK